MIIPTSSVMRRNASRGAFLFLAVVAPVTPLRAQQAPQLQQTPADTMYLHAHGLVSRGRGAEGRALVDSLLLATPPGTPAYAEGLFWRAVTATRAEDAERDYLKIVIEFPLSPRAEDALIRLAELEMMRGDRTRAQRHLQRLIIEHPNGAARARASYWLARVFFEANDLPRACNELNVARARAAASDVELRNQVEYQAQRCVGVNVVVAPPQAPAPGSGSTAAPGPVPSAGSAAPAGGGLLPAPLTTSGTGATGAATTGTSGTGGTGTSATGSGTGSATAPVTPTVPPPSATTTTIPAPSPPQASPPRAPASVPAARRSGPEFTVQVAAFPTRAAADSFMESVRARGYDVRVWGTAAPFRVRVGRFATRAEAAVIAQELRTRMISKDAFVAEAEVR